MKVNLSDKLTSKELEIFNFIASLSKKKDCEVRLVGGIVRDVLLGREHNDMDVATTMSPAEVVKTFAGKLFGKSIVVAIPTGILHGTVTLVFDGVPIEITTLRKDVTTDGRNATVEFTDSWKDDASRRDFTINAMSISVDGEVHDYFDGIEDLRLKKLRFVGHPATRLREDTLRSLRYFRIWSEIGCGPMNEDDPDLVAATKTSLSNLPVERVWRELAKLLRGKYRTQVLTCIMATEYYKKCGLPEMTVSDTVIIPIIFKYYDGAGQFSVPIALANLLFNHSVDDFCDKMKVDNGTRAAAKYLLDTPAMSDMDDARARLARGDVAEHVALKANYCALPEVAEWVRTESKNAPKFPINGGDVVAAGFVGREISEMLSHLREAWIASGFTATRETLLEDLKKS